MNPLRLRTSEQRWKLAHDWWSTFDSKMTVGKVGKMGNLDTLMSIQKHCGNNKPELASIFVLVSVVCYT